MSWKPGENCDLPLSRGFQQASRGQKGLRDSCREIPGSIHRPQSRDPRVHERAGPARVTIYARRCLRKEPSIVNSRVFST